MNLLLLAALPAIAYCHAPQQRYIFTDQTFTNGGLDSANEDDHFVYSVVTKHAELSHSESDYDVIEKDAFKFTIEMGPQKGPTFIGEELSTLRARVEYFEDQTCMEPEDVLYYVETRDGGAELEGIIDGGDLPDDIDNLVLLWDPLEDLVLNDVHGDNHGRAVEVKQITATFIAASSNLDFTGLSLSEYLTATFTFYLTVEECNISHRGETIVLLPNQMNYTVDIVKAPVELSGDVGAGSDATIVDDPPTLPSLQLLQVIESNAEKNASPQINEDVDGLTVMRFGPRASLAYADHARVSDENLMSVLGFDHELTEVDVSMNTLQCTGENEHLSLLVLFTLGDSDVDTAKTTTLWAPIKLTVDMLGPQNTTSSASTLTYGSMLTAALLGLAVL